MSRRIATLIGVLVAVALVAPLLAPYDPERQHHDFLHAPPMRPHLVAESGLAAPFVYPIVLADRLSQRYAEDRTRRASLPWFGGGGEPVFLLGSDSFGRDLLSRLLYGARISIALALTAVLGAVALGALIGGFAGYRGGWIDDVVMRVADFVLILPVIYVALMLRAVMPLVLPPATVFVSMATIFTLLGWPFVAKGVRGIIATEREQEYVAAARSLGASGWHLLSRHLLPACRGFLLAQAALLLPAFVLAEATLSYIGLGFPEHLPTWGTMLIEAASVTAMTRFPWMLAPAAAIFLVVLSANVILQSDKIVRRPI
jgi:peptide/nickel transport system permease protein